jgi:hypothetical protein
MTIEAQWGLYKHDPHMQTKSIVYAVAAGYLGYLATGSAFAATAIGAGTSVGLVGMETGEQLRDIHDREADFSAHPPLSGPRSLSAINERYADPKDD